MIATGAAAGCRKRAAVRATLRRRVLPAVLAASLFWTPVSATTSGVDHLAERPIAELLVTSAPAVEPFAEHAMPAMPIFFGQSFDGVLSPDAGMAITRYGETVDRAGEPKPQPVAAFEIDLVEGETLSFGGRAALNSVGASVRFFRAGEARDGTVAWTFVPEWSSALGGAPMFQCLTTVQVKESGRYRIELSGNAYYRVHYRFFILDDRQRAPTPRPLCGGRSLESAAPYFARPGRPATLELARQWQGRELVFESPFPPVHDGGVSAGAVAYAASRPAALRPFHEALYAGGEHNAVLNFAKLGLAAMEAGEYAEAEWAFDEALARIEAIYGRNAIAQAARSKWVDEAIKDFKGEPYERAMAFYYRGLLYLREGDYENARATFRAGEFQDTLSEAERFRGDFALLDYLAGWSSQCMGDDDAADEAYALAASINPGLRRPAPGQDTLVLADLGRGPVKIGRGRRDSLLAIVDSPDSGRDEHARVRVAGAPPVDLVEASNLYFQASTRGGRAFTAILDGKAGFKGAMSKASDVAFGLGQSGDPTAAVAGLVIGTLTGLVAGEVRPAADTRVWDSLPHRVSAAAVSVPANASFEFVHSGRPAGPASAVPVMRARHGRCAIAWSRSRSALEAGAGARGTDAETVKARAKNREARAMDEAFRNDLATGRWSTAE